MLFKFGQAPKKCFHIHLWPNVYDFDQFNNYIYCLVSFIYFIVCFFFFIVSLNAEARVCCAINANIYVEFVLCMIVEWGPFKCIYNISLNGFPNGWQCHRAHALSVAPQLLIDIFFLYFWLAPKRIRNRKFSRFGEHMYWNRKFVHVILNAILTQAMKYGTYLFFFVYQNSGWLFKRTTADRGNFWCNLIMGKLVEDITYYSADGLCGRMGPCSVNAYTNTTMQLIRRYEIWKIINDYGYCWAERKKSVYNTRQ